MSDHVEEEPPQQQEPLDQSTAAVTKRQVRFGPVPEIVVYDGSLTEVEKDLLWHDADELRDRARREIHLARKVWKSNRGVLATGNSSSSSSSDGYCIRGLEKRLRSGDAIRKKWYTFLQSFLALQQDLRKLESDVTNLIMVFVSTHSKADRAAAHQVALQDEALAFQIYNDESGEDGRRSSSKKLNLSNHGDQQPQQQQQQRSSVGCRRARSA
ncbi:expressed unknown protein [Seminavis robusta]|uniref:Uncharacterized protein n=1 Tax=Seminavis robusta TaxID=568900 RepID=A0A9N8DHF9_9STRA|nr:expressed unknown protein [Seminavis robusta]|eukprot:Sro123_g059540.1 n/a (213) ;mRNA; r:47802-48440